MNVFQCFALKKTMNVFLWERRWMYFFKEDDECISLKKTMNVFLWERRWMYFFKEDDECISVYIKFVLPNHMFLYADT